MDIDSQAVEVTKLSLLLKVLEGESDQSLQTMLVFYEGRVLPNLGNNIKCGNSLIGPDFYQQGTLGLYDEEELYRINAFDWQSEFSQVFMHSGGFDAVIGNPPYVRIQALKEWAPKEVEFYKVIYKSASKGNYDIYVVFVEKGFSLLNNNGRLGFILPHKFFNAKYGESLRQMISEGKHLSKIVHFGDQQVFENATTYTCLLFLEKLSKETFNFVKVTDLKSWQSGASGKMGEIDTEKLTSVGWNFTVGNNSELFEKISKIPVKLRDVSEKIFQGLVTSSDSIYLLDPIGIEHNGFICVKSKATNQEYQLETDVVKPLLKGSRDISPYSAVPSKRVLFPYNPVDSAKIGRTILISSDVFKTNYPSSWKYLEENYENLRNREKGKMRHSGWYGYVYPKSVSLFNKPKILTPSIASRASFTFDKYGEYYFVGSGGGGGGGYGIILNENFNITYEYLLGLLNSKLLDYFLKKISSLFRGGYYAFSKQYIEQLPIRTIDFSNPVDVKKHERMVAMVERMLDLHKKAAAPVTPGEKTMLQRQIDTTDRQIDQLVYELYDLTEDEIKIVENSQP